LKEVNKERKSKGRNKKENLEGKKYEKRRKLEAVKEERKR